MTFDTQQSGGGGLSYLSHLRGYLPSRSQLQGLGSFVAQTVANGATAATLALQSAQDKQKASQPPRVVLWKSFEEFEHAGRRYLFLVVALIDGFQIFEVGATNACRLVAQHSDAPPMNMQAVGGRGGGEMDLALLNQKALAATPIGSIKFVTHPAHQQEHAGLEGGNTANASSAPSGQQQPYYGSLLAVTSAEDRSSFPRNVVKFFSLPLGRYVHLLRFRSRVFGVHTHVNSRYMIVALESEMHVYTTYSASDPTVVALECVWSSSIMPNPSPHIQAALNQGAMAYQQMQAAAAGVGVGGGSAHASLPPPHLSHPPVCLGSNPSHLISTSTWCKEEWSVMAISKRWVAYCPAEPMSPTQGYAMGGAGGMGGEEQMHKSPLFQPLSSSSPTLGPSAPGTVLGGVASGGSTFSLPSSALSHPHPESLSTVAQGIASGLYNLGSTGRKTLVNYLGGEAAGAEGSAAHFTPRPSMSPSSSPTSSATSASAASRSSAHSSSGGMLGTVLIRDLVTQRLVSLIHAHPKVQITHLQFDSSGTLLATVPVDGQYIHVYQVVVVPQPVVGGFNEGGSGVSAGGVGVEGGSTTASAQASRRGSMNTHSPSIHPYPSPVTGGTTGAGVAAGSFSPAPTYHTRFLYRLFRGITHASIRCLSFSRDSRYLSVVSTKGTVHLYALNPLLGGDVSEKTHGPIQVVRAHENALQQQLVSKYRVLLQQQHIISAQRAAKIKQMGAAAAGGSLSSSSAASSTSLTDDSGLMGLDSFLYQPKTLSSIYRIKAPTHAVSSVSPSPLSSAASSRYMPVIATFARLPSSSADQGLGVETPHHLCICGWNEELAIYALSTAYKETVEAAQKNAAGGGATGAAGADGRRFSSSSLVAHFSSLSLPSSSDSQLSRDHSPEDMVEDYGSSSSGGGGASVPSSSSTPKGKSVDVARQKPKLALLVQPLASFELHATTLHNSQTYRSVQSGGAERTHPSYQPPQAYSSPHSQQQHAPVQPHQHHLLSHSEEEQSVRIIRAAGQEEEPHPSVAFSHSPRLGPSAQPVAAAAPITFFQEMEGDRWNQHAQGGKTASAAAHVPPVSLPPPSAASTASALSTHSPIFSALASAGPQQYPPSPSSSSVPAAAAPSVPPSTTASSHWLSEVELRTYETPDVPLWANTHFELCHYERSVASVGAAANVYIDKLGWKPMSETGSKEQVGSSNSLASLTSSSSSAASPTDLEQDLRSALSSSMLDDAGFVAALLRGGTDSSMGGGFDPASLADAHHFLPFDPSASASSSASLSSSFSPSSSPRDRSHSDGQQSVIFGVANQQSGADSGEGANKGVPPVQLTSIIQEQYYQPRPTPQPAQEEKEQTQMKLPTPTREHAAATATASHPPSSHPPSSHPSSREPTPSSLSSSSPPPVDPSDRRTPPFPSSHLSSSSVLFPSTATASEILSLRLPPSRRDAEESVLLSPPFDLPHEQQERSQPQSQSQSQPQQEEEQEVTEQKEQAGVSESNNSTPPSANATKPKKKKKSKLQVQEMTE